MLSNEFTAFILGIVEGLTEFIPVSSTGHLILVAELLKFEGEKAKLFEIFIQLGAILAVVLLYPRFFIELLLFKKAERGSFSGIPGLLKLGAGALPVFVLGFLTHKYIKAHLFNSFTVSIGLIAGSILILAAERNPGRSAKSRIEQITLLDCFKVGLFQCLALWPGFSRAGATIVGGLLIGFERKLAAEFSFLLAVPVLAAAVFYDLYKNFKLLSPEDLSMFAIGFITSFFIALLAVKFFLGYLRTRDFKIFAYYRIILALLVLALI